MIDWERTPRIAIEKALRKTNLNITGLSYLPKDTLIEYAEKIFETDERQMFLTNLERERFDELQRIEKRKKQTKLKRKWWN